MSGAGVSNQSDRYARQVMLSQVGEAGQAKLRAGRALLVGCGALGTVIAENLVRAGVGELTIVDRDVVEETNLQRQTLFTERDAALGAAKAEAASARLGEVNAGVRVRAIVDDLAAMDVEGLVSGAEVVIDATDNFETRYVLNDAAVKRSKPFVYGGVVSTRGTQMTVVPGVTPCLRCMSDEPGTASETCETAGVLGAAVLVVAGLQCADAMRILTGHIDGVGGQLRVVDVWSGEIRTLDVSGIRSPACPCCAKGRYEFLDGARGSVTTGLCGRGAVQVLSSSGIELERVVDGLARVGDVERVGSVVRAELVHEGVTLRVFASGRVIVEGVEDEVRARSIVSRYLGV